MKKDWMNSRCFVIVVFVVVVIGLIFMMSGIFGPKYIEKKLIEGIKKELVVDSLKSEGYSHFQDSSVPLYYNAYIFNVTNYKQVELGIEKPKLDELGPYVYLEKQFLFDISFVDNGDVQRFKTWKYFLFDKQTTPPYLSESDVICTPNLAFFSANMQLGNFWYDQLLFSLVASSSNSTPFTCRTVDELMWGYNDTLLQELSALQPNLSSVIQWGINYTSVKQAGDLTLFDQYNSGKGDIEKVKNMISWQDQSKLDVWGSDACNTIKGTDGTQFKPGIVQSDVLDTFVTDAYRQMELTSDGTIIKVEGIDLMRFSPPTSTSWNATLWPPNAGYYQFGKSGLINITKARGGIPIFLSAPHFFEADPCFVHSIEGLHPSADLHQTRINIEPITGTTLSAQKRLQLLLRIDSKLNIGLISPPKIHPSACQCEEGVAYIPIAWFEEASTVTPALAKEFRSQVYTIMYLKDCLLWGGGIVGGVLLFLGVAGAIMILVSHFKTRKTRLAGLYSPVNAQDGETLFEAEDDE